MTQVPDSKPGMRKIPEEINENTLSINLSKIRPVLYLPIISRIIFFDRGNIGCPYFRILHFKRAKSD